MIKVFPLLMILSSIVCSAQAIRITKASKDFDVVVDPVTCDSDNKCGPIKATLYRKRSRNPFQVVDGSRISKSDLDSAVQFQDFNFDGVKDFVLFDGYTAPGGNITESKRIYLYTVSANRFVFNAELSSLSRDESIEIVPKRKIIRTYARPGSGVFQWRNYVVKKDRPVMIEEVISDSQVDNGTRTLITTKKLINGQWRTWTKHTKTIFNQ